MSTPTPNDLPKKKGGVQKIIGLVRDEAWRTDHLGDRSARGRTFALIRVVSTTVTGVIQNKVPLNAAALTYYTLMSLGPMLALALTISGAILQRQENGHALLKEKFSEVIQNIAPQTGALTSDVTVDKRPKTSVLTRVAGDAALTEATIRAAGKAAIGHGHTGAHTEPARPATDVTVTIGSMPDGTVVQTEFVPVDALAEEQEEERDSISHALDEMVDKLLEKSASGSAGVVGTTILIVLAVLMLTRVENAFNTIWGVTKGRPWKDRFVNYVLFLMLGCILGAASLTMISVGSLANSLGSAVPDWVFDWRYGPVLLSFFRGFGPLAISFAMLVTLTTVIIRFMPYTRVKWLPALAGGLFTSAALILNQKLGILYAGKVAQFQNLYGSMSIILVLMFGLYLAWMILLIGGQLTFAIQYVHRLAAYRTWESLASRTRLTLCFGCLVVIARRFRNMTEAPDAEQLAAVLHVPRSLIDESLKRLVAMGLVVALKDGDNRADNDRYRPDFPLDKMTVGAIRDRIETYNTASRIDPSINFDDGLVSFCEDFATFGEYGCSKRTLETLIAETEHHDEPAPQPAPAVAG